MPRQVRIEYPGARYHVMSRGNRREYILGGEDDKNAFLETLAETCERTGWILHSYVLMGTHFHMLLETPEPNLSSGMRWLQGTYGNRYNRRHGLVGHVWQGRFKSPLISDEGDEHFLAVSEYIHLNPVVSGQLLEDGRKLLDYPWSSFPFLCRTPARRPDWLRAQALLRAYDLPGDTPTSRRNYGKRMELKCIEAMQGGLDDEQEALRKRLSRGWYIGDKSFKERMQEHLRQSVRGRKPSSLYGSGKRAHDEQAAQDLLRKAAAVLDFPLEHASAYRPGHPEKQMLCALVRTRTTVTAEWIVKELSMGTTRSVYAASQAVQAYTGAQAKRWKQLQKLPDFLH